MNSRLFSCADLPEMIRVLCMGAPCTDARENMAMRWHISACPECHATTRLLHHDKRPFCKSLSRLPVALYRTRRLAAPDNADSRSVVALMPLREAIAIIQHAEGRACDMCALWLPRWERRGRVELSAVPIEQRVVDIEASPAPRIRDVFDLPECVVKDDFVIQIHDGIRDEEDTLKTYVPTPRIVKAFERVFGLVKSSLENGTSSGAFLHGSYGSGKSHFLAVLALLLSHRTKAWERSEFHDLRAAHTWVGKKKLLVLPVHCFGTKTLEDRVFEDYVGFVREKHPSAAAPDMFRDEELFDLAREGLRQQGEEAFLRILNTHPETECAWTREKFEAAAGSSDSTTRHGLFTALVATHFPAFVKGCGHFLDFAPGLDALAAHAKQLGYDGIVLLLDDVIYWLATLDGDVTRLSSEVRKIRSLVETSTQTRAIAIVSLMARLGDLRDLLGETTGAIDTQLDFWKERFESIDLPDREFAQILNRRILRPKDDGTKREIEQSYEEYRRSISQAERDLLSGYTEEDFQRVYPFSLAFIDSLVRYSSRAQRERTSLRIVTDLLNHVGDRSVGSIVPLGDLYKILGLEDFTRS